MPRDLFRDLEPKRGIRGGWRALPASLALHILAAAAVAVFVVRPVASAIAEARPGALRWQAAEPARARVEVRPARPAGATPRPAGDVRAPAPAAAPVPIVPVDLLNPAPADFDDSPPPCLTNCGDGPPGSAGVGIGLGAGRGEEETGTGSGSPLPIGGDLRAPRKTHTVLPEYPELARRAGVGGVVIVQCVIDVDGHVSDARVLRGHPLLDTAAVEAVRQWRYEPTRLNGIAVPVVMTVTMTFQPQR